MAVFNDYNSTGKLLAHRNEPLTGTNIDRYIAEHGIERAQGYFDAMNDFHKQVAEIIGNRTGNGTVYSANTIAKNITVYWKHINNFMNDVSDKPDLTNILKPDNS